MEGGVCTLNLFQPKNWGGNEIPDFFWSFCTLPYLGDMRKSLGPNLSQRKEALALWPSYQIRILSLRLMISWRVMRRDTGLISIPITYHPLPATTTTTITYFLPSFLDPPTPNLLSTEGVRRQEEVTIHSHQLPTSRYCILYNVCESKRKNWNI